MAMLAAALVITGCCATSTAKSSARSSYQSAPAPKTTTTAAAPRTTTPAPAPSTTPAPRPAGGYGPSNATFEEGGIKYVRGSMAFPTGLRESSGLLLEKVVPAEVLVGKPFSYEYRVINLTDYHLSQVTVMDRVTDNFQVSNSDPAADMVNAGVATWKIDHLGPRETKVIKVTGSASTEGTVTTCGWATYSPILCEPIKVVKPAIELVKTMPAQVTQCDPIPVRLVVKNSGSSALTMVKVTDSLPSGLTTDAGQSSVSFDAGTLGPGESKEFSFNAKAASTGTFNNPAKATSAQGVEAEAQASVKVVKPVLTIACETPQQAIFGRNFESCITVQNTGDTASANTVISVALSGGRLVSATDGGAAAGAGVTWNIGSLAPGATKRVCMTVVGDAGSLISINATAQGACAEQVATSCKTPVIGVPGILLEVVDDVDPIPVGETTTYTIRVTNQGNSPITNVKVVGKRDLESQEVVSASGATEVTRVADGVGMAVVPTLAAKQTVEWKVVVRATKVENALFQVTLTSDQLREAMETESTNQY